MSKQSLDVQQMQHLQELGFELHPGLFCWVHAPLLGKYELGLYRPEYGNKVVPAYTLQDVLGALPKYYHIANIGWTKLSIRVHTTKEWEIGYVYTDELSKYAYGCRILGKELIDAAYELFCWCVEWGFVETNKNE